MRKILLISTLMAVALAGCQHDQQAAVHTQAEMPGEPSATASRDAVPIAPDNSLPAVPGNGVDPDSYARHVATLASDEFEGRAPGTRGERLTVNYLVSEFAALGLQPGYGDSFLQPVPMVEMTNEERSPLRLANGDEHWQMGFPEEMITWSRRGGTEPHAIEDSELVFVGYGVVAPEYDWNDYAGLDVTGKTVVILVNDPGFATGDDALFNGRAMTYYGRWTYKYEEAARQGAAAALIVHDTEPASYPWEVVINSWSQAQFELGDAGEEPLMPIEGWITLDGARDLFARSGEDFDALMEQAKAPGFEAVALGTTASASVRQSVREGVSYNVLGLLPGTERPDEAIIYVAHWDHLGRNLAIPGSAGIYNGAIDNASGTAGLMEIAQLFQHGQAPERSVLFLAVTLEEYGLLGSRYYANNPVFPPEQTVAAINMDALSLVGPTHDVVVVGYGSSELEPLLERAVQAQGREMVPEPSPEGGFYYRSDHFNFARAGIPALYAKGGVEHRELGREHGLAWERDYRDIRYHKPADVFEPDWDLRGVAEDLELLYVVGRYLADGKDWPNWFPGNEFRATRDRQRPSQ